MTAEAAHGGGAASGGANNGGRHPAPGVELGTARPVLFYDGSCGFCDATIQFVLRRDRVGRLTFAPLDGPSAARLLRRHPRLIGVDSLVWAEPESDGAIGERVLVRSDAALQIARYLGWPWSLALMARLAPRRLRDLVYDAFARHRKRIMSAPTSCVIPSAETRARFLE